MIDIEVNTKTTNKDDDITSFANIGDEYYELIVNNIKNIAEIVKAGVQDNLEQGKDIFGNAVAPKKSGGRIFYDTGELFKSVLSQQKAKDEFQIYINGNRSEIMYYLNQGTDKMPARQAFGLSVDTNKKTDDYINNLLNTTK